MSATDRALIQIFIVLKDRFSVTCCVAFSVNGHLNEMSKLFYDRRISLRISSILQNHDPMSSYGALPSALVSTRNSADCLFKTSYIRAGKYYSVNCNDSDGWYGRMVVVVREPVNQEKLVKSTGFQNGLNGQVFHE